MVDPQLQSALSQDGVILFGGVKIAFPSGTVRLLDGAGRVDVAGEIYLGEDPTFGTLDTISVISEADGDTQPELSMTLSPPDSSAAAVLANSDMQGSVVTVLVGAVDQATGLPIGTPEIKFLGEIDVPELVLTKGERKIEYTILSVFERLFELEEGVRASDGWHQSIWPGERGLEYMVGTEKSLYWGGTKPVSSGTAVGGGGRQFLDPGLYLSSL